MSEKRPYYAANTTSASSALMAADEIDWKQVAERAIDQLDACHQANRLL